MGGCLSLFFYSLCSSSNNNCGSLVKMAYLPGSVSMGTYVSVGDIDKGMQQNVLERECHYMCDRVSVPAVNWGCAGKECRASQVGRVLVSCLRPSSL